RRHTRFSRDWSSDVCSSDLWTMTRFHPPLLTLPLLLFGVSSGEVPSIARWEAVGGSEPRAAATPLVATRTGADVVRIPGGRFVRSEERRVGKGCRTRWPRER